MHQWKRTMMIELAASAASLLQSIIQRPSKLGYSHRGHIAPSRGLSLVRVGSSMHGLCIMDSCGLLGPGDHLTRNMQTNSTAEYSKPEQKILLRMYSSAVTYSQKRFVGIAWMDEEGGKV